MTSCYISSKKIKHLEEKMTGLLEDKDLVKEALNLVYETLNFSEEKYAQHLIVQNNGVKRYIERKKANGESLSAYSETKKAYYQKNKEEIKKKRVENYHKKRNAEVVTT